MDTHKPIGGAMDIIDGVSSAASTTAKISKWALPALVIIAAAVIAAPYAAPHVRRAIKAIK